MFCPGSETTQGSCSTFICLGSSWPNVRSYDVDMPALVCHSGLHFSHCKERGIYRITFISCLNKLLNKSDESPSRSVVVQTYEMNLPLRYSLLSHSQGEMPLLRCRCCYGSNSSVRGSDCGSLLAVVSDQNSRSAAFTDEIVKYKLIFS